MTIQCSVCLHENTDDTLACTMCGNPLIEFTPHRAMSHALTHLPSGTLLKQGTYRIDNTLGTGGFGITYQGFDLGHQRLIAVKENFPDRDASRQEKTVLWAMSRKQQRELIDGFLREAQRLAKCKHPNIVEVYDWFEENNTAYIVMALILGESLQEICELEGILPEARVQRYFIQVAEALSVVHQHDLLHRDIKPANILVNDQDQAILIDFGTAREFSEGKTSHMTRYLTGEYAPPEQYTVRARRNPSTDIYALCASMYELLTGELPLEAPERLQSDHLKPPRQIVPQISKLMEQVILTGMRIDVNERFQSADELIQALQAGAFVSPSLSRSRRFAQQGQLQEAVQSYQKYLAYADDATALVEFAIVLLHVEERQGVSQPSCQEIAQQALQLTQTDGRLYGILGLLHCREANWSEAVQSLRQGVAFAPQQAWIHANLAWALGKLGEWQQAKTEIEQSLALESQSVFALGVKAWIAANQQEWRMVIPSVRRAITKSKTSTLELDKQYQHWLYPCLLIAIDQAMMNPDSPDLEIALREAIAQVPESGFALGFRAWKQSQKRQWHQALLDLTQALQKPNVSPWIVLNLGVVQEQLKQTQAAIQTYEMLPQNVDAAFRLGTLFAQQSQWSIAQSHLEQAIQLRPNFAPAHHNLAWVLAKLSQQGSVKDEREVRSHYSTAVKLYLDQGKAAMANRIKNAFQAIGIEL